MSRIQPPRVACAPAELVTVHRPYFLDDTHAQNAWMLKTDPQVETGIVDDEKAYLAQVGARVTEGTEVSTASHVLSGSAIDPIAITETILKSAAHKKANLLVMATRARGLVNRVGLGSVADGLVRGSNVPVVLIPPGYADASVQTPFPSNILIPLDGSGLSEQILEPALELARCMGARCILLQVVPRPGANTRAKQYLERVASTPRARGLAVDTEVVVARKPGEVILEVAQTHQCDLIALETRGDGGFKRLVLGSVADKLVQHAQIPLLVRSPAQS